MNGRLVRRADLSQVERGAMFSLLAAHFDGVDDITFNRDLDEKNWVVILESEGRLKGFTTLLAYETVHEGEAISVVYSGDTIMERGAWNTSLLPRSWIAAVRRLRETHLRGRRLYWLLLTSGFRTYRLLPVFWREFYPRHDAAAPDRLRALASALAVERFGLCYRSDRGIVQFPSPQALRNGLSDVPFGRLRDPHVAYFLEHNPGWRRGDELVCLTEIRFENLTAAGRRMWLRDRFENVDLERVG